LDAGAFGFVLKDMADTQLGHAVRRAALRRRYVSPQVAASVEALGAAAQGC
jgi:DNA-binding NarL/FixJ family response regulator